MYVKDHVFTDSCKGVRVRKFRGLDRLLVGEARRRKLELYSLCNRFVYYPASDLTVKPTVSPCLWMTIGFTFHMGKGNV